MGKRETAVVPQWAKHRVGIDLVACSCQKAATTIVAQIVAERGDRAVEAGDIYARSAGLQDGVSNRHERCKVEDAAAVVAGRVAAQGRVFDRQGRGAVAPVVADGAAVASRVAAESAVADGQRRGAVKGLVVDAAAAAEAGGRVAADRA